MRRRLRTPLCHADGAARRARLAQALAPTGTRTPWSARASRTSSPPSRELARTCSASRAWVPMGRRCADPFARGLASRALIGMCLRGACTRGAGSSGSTAMSLSGSVVEPTGGSGGWGSLSTVAAAISGLRRALVGELLDLLRQLRGSRRRLGGGSDVGSLDVAGAVSGARSGAGSIAEVEIGASMTRVLGSTSASSESAGGSPRSATAVTSGLLERRRLARGDVDGIAGRVVEPRQDALGVELAVRMRGVAGRAGRRAGENGEAEPAGEQRGEEPAHAHRLARPRGRARQPARGAVGRARTSSTR